MKYLQHGNLATFTIIGGGRTTLGAGQDVGRSCVLLRMGGKHIMLDCGMHMGYNDDRRFPDFSYIAPYHPSTNYTSMIDCVIISHFHLDHCGALPFFTECLGYDGPIYMTYPTRKIAPILLEDFRKIMITPDSFFTEADIKNCMKKVIPVDVNQAIQVDPQLTIRAYYAGHVLGAAMFHIQVTVPVTNSVSCPSASFTFHPFNTPRLPHPSLTCVYTGDYNTTPDRHLGPAQIDRCRPDVLVTETTYATYTRDSKRTREQAFLEACHQTVAQGGKVLIPVFALGRAQELCILVDGYWERMGRELQKVPVYFSAGLTEKANEYYKLFLQWTNESLRESFVERNPFDFKHIRPFTHMTQADAPTPMVLFATPGMLHAGTSLNIFLKWCSNPLNAVILPGYCVPGTVGARVLAGERIIPLDRWTNVEVRCKVYNLSFSAHADAKGIMSLISACEPKNVVLIHGEKSKMAMLKERIVKEKGIPCFDPGNGTTVTIEVARDFVARVDRELI
ncbi:Metallo-hydrolase/oxidoreductase, partial [Gonapodya prolifera JEL478]